MLKCIFNFVCESVIGVTQITQFKQENGELKFFEYFKIYIW